MFGVDAGGYHAARLGYPAELYDAICRRTGDRAGMSILEIGPGTGLATKDLLAFDPARLTAVEADAALAAHLREAVEDSRLEIVTAGFVEAAVSGVFDLACSAAAFHWLEPEPAFAKLRGLLRPGATLALWWNVYRQAGVGDAFADAVTPLLAGIDLPPSEGPDGHYSLDIELHRAAMTGGGFADFTPCLFRRERTLDTAQIRALYASYSYIRVMPEARRTALLDAICTLADVEFGGAVPNVTLTPLYMATATGG